MKTKLFLMLIFTSSILFAQDSIQNKKSETRLIALTPLSNKIEKVNGLAIGLGLDEVYESMSNQKIINPKIVNGVNVEINPLGIVWICFYKPDRSENGETSIVNGLNLSTAGFLKNTSHNGLNFSIYNYGRKMNGISFTFFGTYVESLNGFYFSCFGNSAKKGRGISISALNDINDFKGIQLGIVNQTENMKGIQIGLINKNTKGKNFQIGFWNKNSKRTMPILNF